MTDKQSKYCYLGTDVLINYADLRSQESLSKFEDVVTTRRLVQLHEGFLRGKFDLHHLKKIHYHIFQDVYPFAGQLRTEDISKGFHFARHPYIEKEADKLFSNLARENRLTTLTADAFSKKAAYYFAELNVLHPFREGNGRTQREFIRQLGRNAGYDLDWTRSLPEITLEASIRSVTDTSQLTDVIRSSIVNQQPDKTIYREYRGRNKDHER